MNKLKTYIRELTSIHGVSSREDRVIDYMSKIMNRYDEELSIDTLGNVICRISSGKPGARKLMIFAHMDEIGFIVRKVEPNGFLRVERIGGVHVNVLPGLRVDIIGSKGIVTGVIGTKSHHFVKPNEKGIVPSTEDLYIDIGASTMKQAREAGVDVGSFATYHPDFIELQGGLLTNKAMDNRAACAILLDLAEALYEQRESLQWDCYLVACVQEEFNIRGIMPAVRRINPDVSIGIDATPSCDTPDLAGFSDVVIGGGPALTMMNFHGRGTLAGVLPDEKLLNFLMSVAEKEEIAFQKEVALGVITENAFISFEGSGVSVASVSIPTRYTHTPVETISLHDVEQLKTLLFRFVLSLNSTARFGKQRKEDSI